MQTAARRPARQLHASTIHSQVSMTAPLVAADLLSRAAASENRRLPERRGGHPLTRSHFHEARKESDVDTDRVEGKAKETEGEIQQKWGEAKDKARDTWEDVKDKVEDVVDRGEDKVDDLNEPDRTEESTATR